MKQIAIPREAWHWLEERARQKGFNRPEEYLLHLINRAEALTYDGTAGVKAYFKQLREIF